MEFLDLLRVLSKSSPFAVKTLSDESKRGELQLFKDYLYVKTEIEKDFEQKLEEALLGQKKIIFLCGSSGDGKSEILTRYRALLHKDLKCKAPLIEPNLRRNLGKW
ncbi:DNA phosphorothioation-dependent restriction protein DptF, partial [Acinetobacter baumannii]